jgi:hypothetical protein
MTAPAMRGRPTRIVPERDIPPEVLTLLRERLSGLDELEVLLLARSDPSRRWTASAVAERLGLPDRASEPVLASLQANGMVVEEGRGAEREFSYRPATPALDATVSSLATIYHERPLEVMRILSHSALERIRSAAARTFADAFVIGGNGRKKDG